ncbi:MAG: cupin domain-containing protein [Candidatus Bathyarchaeota archaeon]|nr:MAG: cupin domain-containing protein [Candidatus Bathyarchaeota archaeon]
MELISRKSTKVIIFEKDKQPFVFKQPVRDNAYGNRIRNAISHDAEIRIYYKPDVNLEVIKTLVPPNYEQPWHTHKKVQEAVLVIDGQVEVLTENKQKTHRTVLKEGDLVVFDRDPNSFHTIRNSTTKYSKTLTFKFLGPDKKQGEIFNGDWYGKSSEK